VALPALEKRGHIVVAIATQIGWRKCVSDNDLIVFNIMTCIAFTSRERFVRIAGELCLFGYRVGVVTVTARYIGHAREIMLSHRILVTAFADGRFRIDQQIGVIRGVRRVADLTFSLAKRLVGVLISKYTGELSVAEHTHGTLFKLSQKRLFI
jgi:hypothetical protein